MLEALDIAFFAFHTGLIVFNAVGWIWRRTRMAHLVTVGLTAFSWFALGYFYGWGYCICTDWHFMVRRQLGYQDPERSYVQLLASHLLGISMSEPVANVVAAVVFLLIILATAAVWLGPPCSRLLGWSRPAEASDAPFDNTAEPSVPLRHGEEEP